MAKRKFKEKFNGGQRVISTIQEHSSNFIANFLLNAAKSWKAIGEVLSAFQWNDYKYATQLIMTDPRLSNIIFMVNEKENMNEERPRVINRTKILKAQQQEEERKEQEIFALKLKLLQEQYKKN